MITFDSIHPIAQYEQYNPVAAVKKGLSDVSCETSLMVPIGIALLIIAGLTLGGVMEGSTAAWSMIGLSIPLVIGSVIHALRDHSRAERINALFQSIMFSVALVMGSLALINIMPMTTATITILSVIATDFIVQNIIAHCCKKQDQYQPIDNSY